jgi:ATP-dependent DNA helicase RecQ
LREEKILADAKDLTAFIKSGETHDHSLRIFKSYAKIEKFLHPVFEEQEKPFHLKELNEQAEVNGCKDVTPNKIKTIINFWAIKNWIKRQSEDFSRNHLRIVYVQPKESLEVKLEKRHVFAEFIIKYLHDKSEESIPSGEAEKDQVLVGFSVHELKEAYEKSLSLHKLDISIDDVEDTLFYLSRIDAIKIEGGFLVIYNRLTLERIEKDNKKRYKKDDYQKLNRFYENKVQQIHIVGEYAKKMLDNYKEALQFVEDYFQLNYASFLNKYFKGSRQNEIKKSLTPAKFRQLFGELSPAQLKIINDNQSKHIVVAAGPGSGKTRLLVHKLASLLLMEDVKHEQLLMVTFSRAAATEFKKRLISLIGNAANYVEIKTFHSYCFELLGKIGTIEKSGEIIRNTIEKIQNKEVEANRITKTVLVIDEAQDMDADEFALINVLMEQNEEMRVIAVGDDDQNIYEFRGSNSKYLEQFITEKEAARYELIENYRSKSNLINYTNLFVGKISYRLKTTPIIALQPGNGKIKIIAYQSQFLTTPLVNDILSTDISGTCCVLTNTNEEALQITGLLLKNRMPAKLIQTNDEFSLYNLVEVRFFIDQLSLSEEMYIVNDEMWANAKRKFWDKFRNSSKAEICISIIKDFEAANPKKKYKSDLEIFIRESRLEDFANTNGETIFVSTMHKAKGKEFDNVFIMLDNFNISSEEKKRQLYVAMTRAKNNLTIHTNGHYLDDIQTEQLEKVIDTNEYLPPDQLVMQLTHRDVWLSYFENKQNLVSELKSGDSLSVEGDDCFNSDGVSVLKFSKQYREQIEKMSEANYEIIKARVHFIVYWLDEEKQKEIKVILPIIYFKKTTD